MFKKGQLLLLEQGAYSSFAYTGPFIVMKDFDKADAVRDFLAATPSKQQDGSAFVAWLARNQFIEDADTQHWYLGDYGFAPLDFESNDEWLAERKALYGAVFRADNYQRTPEAEAAHEAAEAAYAAERAALYADDSLANLTTGMPEEPIGDAKKGGLH